jgi:hypothetical protein
LATISPTVLTAVDFNQTFSQTVNVNPDMSETITSVTATLVGSPLEPDISISINANVVTISGKYTATFTDEFSYLEPGATGPNLTPTVVTGLVNMPPDKNLFKLDQDSRESETRTYNIVVNSSSGSNTIPITQLVLNTLESMRLFMDTYNYKAS